MKIFLLLLGLAVASATSSLVPEDMAEVSEARRLHLEAVDKAEELGSEEEEDKEDDRQLVVGQPLVWQCNPFINPLCRIGFRRVGFVGRPADSDGSVDLEESA